MPEAEKQRQAFQFYGRRKGGRSARGGNLFDELLPRITIPLSAGRRRWIPRRCSRRSTRAVWLEIGFGGGEHLAHQAASHPDIGFLGCEVFEAGIASGSEPHRRAQSRERAPPSRRRARAARRAAAAEPRPRVSAVSRSLAEAPPRTAPLRQPAAISIAWPS